MGAARRGGSERRTGALWAAALLGLGCAACNREAPRDPARAEARGASDGVEAPAPGPWAGAPLPRARLELPTPGEPVGVAWADLAGEGRERLVALTQGPGRLVLWDRLPDRDSPLAQARAFAVGDFALGPRVLARGGAARLGLASRAERSLTLHALTATGDLAEVARLELTAAPRALASGVLSAGALGQGSGEVELLAAALSGGGLVLWSGGARAELLARTDLPLPCSLTLGADGRSLWIGDQSERSLTRFTLEAGVSSEAGRLGLAGIPRDLLEIDLDGDGDLELAVTGGERGLWIFGLGRPGGIEGLLADPAEPFTLEVEPIPMRVVPLQRPGAGAPELALLAHYGLSVTVLAGLGAGEPRRSDAYAGQSPWDLAAGFPGGGGAPALAIANRGAHRISLVLPDAGGGLRFEQRVRAGPAPHSLALGDLDGAGRPAAAVLCSLDATLALLSNRGGKLVPGPRRPAGEGADHVVLTDLDADGHLDAVWLARSVDGLFRLRMAPGDGAGGLGASVELGEPAARSAGDLLALDLDGDGRSELVIADPDGGRVLWRRGADGSTGALEVAGGPRRMAALARGGRRGIALVLGQAGERGGLALLAPLAEGTALGLIEVAFLPLAGTTLDVAACDLDGDGLEDLVALTRLGQGDGVGWVGAHLARGSRWEALEPLETGLRPFAVRAGDLGSDGVVDVLVSAQNSHQVNRWIVELHPSPRLVRAPDLGAGTGCLDLALADVDGDGRLDLVVANAFSDDLAVLLGAP